MEFGNQYHDTSMMHINQTGGKHLKKAFYSSTKILMKRKKLKNDLCLPTMMLNALPPFLMPSTDL